MIPNAPPVEMHGLHIDDLYDEAKGILDGAGVQSDADAEMVSKLLDMLRQAKKAADEQRKVEKRPHDDAAKAVQEAWNPLIEKCDRASTVCKQALAPFLAAKEAEQRAEASRLRAEAEQRQQEAQEALRAAPPTDLAAREKAEALLKEAGKADKAATRADSAKAHATGGSRAVGLRSYFTAEVVDHTAFGRWAWEHRRSDYEALLTTLAEREAKAGVTIPGIIIHEDRKAA